MRLSVVSNLFCGVKVGYFYNRYATLEMRAGPSGESLARPAHPASPVPFDDTADEISTDEFIDEPDIQRMLLKTLLLFIQGHIS